MPTHTRTLNLLAIPLSAVTLLTSLALVGCSPVSAESGDAQARPKQAINIPPNHPNQTLANQSAAKNTQENAQENSLWVRLARPTCH